MNIRGIDKTSLIDYPGKICAVFFIGGCNLRCGFCHNPDIVLNSPLLEPISDDWALEFLKSRKKLLDGVTISGGEPTLSDGLAAFITKIKELHLMVKLDTNGLKPSVLRELLQKRLLDYTALDIKTSPGKYPTLTNNRSDFSVIIDSLNYIKESGIDYEVRTTCIPGYAELDDFIKINEQVGTVKNYYIQQFISQTSLMDEGYKKLKPYPSSHLMEIKKYLETFTDFCNIRGI